jgi:hypothetical protein
MAERHRGRRLAGAATWMQRAERPGTGERGAGTAAVQACSTSGQRGAKGQPVGARSRRAARRGWW